MDEEKTEGVTMGDVFRIIKRRIWYILGATVLFTVVMVLILEFFINPILATYSMDFRLVFPAGGDDVYPDGSPFFYQEIVSREFLTDAKNSSSSFSNIDTDKMYRNGDVVIEAETLTEDGLTEYTGRYTITVEGSYFKNDDQAEDFIKALANVPLAVMRESAKEVNYASNSEMFRNAPFEERLSLLAQEKQNLLSVYDYWVNIYSETYLVRYSDESGTVVRRLKDFRDSVAVLFSERERLESELERNGYYFYNNDPAALEAYKNQLKLEYEQNAKEIALIEGTLGVNSNIALASAASTIDGAGSLGLSQRLTELYTRNTRIDLWINASGTVASPTLTEENVNAFDAKLNEEFDKLNAEAERLTNVIGSIYSRGMAALFEKQKVTSSGDISTLVGAIGCFIGGFIIACIVTYIVETNRKKKSASDETKSEEPETKE